MPFPERLVLVWSERISGRHPLALKQETGNPDSWRTCFIARKRAMNCPLPVYSLYRGLEEIGAALLTFVADRRSANGRAVAGTNPRSILVQERHADHFVLGAMSSRQTAPGSLG